MFRARWTRDDSKPTIHDEKIPLHGTKRPQFIMVECTLAAAPLLQSKGPSSTGRAQSTSGDGRCYGIEDNSLPACPQETTPSKRITGTHTSNLMRDHMTDRMRDHMTGHMREHMTDHMRDHMTGHMRDYMYFILKLLY